MVAVGEGAGTGPAVSAGVHGSSHSRQEKGCWSGRCLAGHSLAGFPASPHPLTFSPHTVCICKEQSLDS